jgi:NADPH:quinone reductase
MRAIVATAEGPSWTERRDVPAPAPAANEALIAVRAFAVNRGELTLVRRRDGWQPGQDVAGEVIQPAADGGGPQAGERVAGLAEWHGWAEQAVVPTHRLAALPDGVDFERAAALPMAGTTAANLVLGGGPLLGARLLVTGASGGVGHLAVQLAALGGARVVAVARAERADALRRYGARDVVADPADAEGPFDLVLESAGGSSLDAALARVAPGGTVLLFGNSSREPSTIDFTGFFGHEEATIRSYFSARHEADAGRLLAMLLDLVATGRLAVEVGFGGSWDRLNEAMDGLSERRFAGKAVLTID